MNNKTFKFKTLTLSVAMATGVSLSMPVSADWWQSTKEAYNGVAFWKAENLSKVSFQNIYPKSFYETSYLPWAIMGGTIVVAGVVSFLTAGAGAPAAAVGVSSVASTVGGGGAGSYMAGLSIVGGWFGGNAMLGAAILNGVSLGTVGGGAAWGTLGVASKVFVATSVSASVLDGVFILAGGKTGELEYRVKVKQPKGIGGKQTREIVDLLDEMENKSNKLLSSKSKYENNLQRAKEKYDVEKVIDLEGKIKKSDELYEALQAQRTVLLSEALNRLKEDNIESLSQEDLIVLSVLAWNNLEYDLFIRAINKLPERDGGDQGYYHYLKALSELAQSNENKAIDHLHRSMEQSSYALEPAILYLAILGQGDFERNKPILEAFVNNVASKFNENKYHSDYNLVALYYRLATIYMIAEEYDKSEIYFIKAKSELGLLKSFNNGEKMIASMVDLALANVNYFKGDIKKADELYNKAINNTDDVDFNSGLSAQYAGNIKEGSEQ